MNTQPRPKGRPAPNGRKRTCTVRLTPDVEAYLRQLGGLAAIEEIVRASRGFKSWKDSQNRD